MARFIKLVGSPFEGFYMKQEGEASQVVFYGQGGKYCGNRWVGEYRYNVSKTDEGEWVGLFVEEY